ncbi:uncharacterized protein RAG0_08678 [Rhynchosporium agropyri]|uniref:Uncharacterized protein n=1 Tax=Rhynchosporium agropyri TaxID=914238 RepID=A0A1E1KUX3_9HELO|nr:uncharacterized protein RAG0_08678 [Rhynchosporium agropyri]
MTTSQYSSTIKTMITADQGDHPERDYLHFIYDYPERYKKAYPGHRYTAVGYVHGWEFHVNQNRQANLRPIFNTSLAGIKPEGEKYLLPTPGLKNPNSLRRPTIPVHGLVFALSKEDDQILEERCELSEYPRSRVWCNATIRRDGIESQVKVSVFVDLRYTCNITEVFITSKVQLEEWENTFLLFLKEGVPKQYILSIIAEIQGQGPDKISPIFVDPEAYRIDFSKMSIDEHSEEADKVIADVHRTPSAALLLDEYYENYGTLAPACPTDSQGAKVFEDLHDGILRGHNTIESQSAAQRKATTSYVDRMSNRCDDGLDVYDAVRKTRGQKPWKHPDTVDVSVEEDDSDDTVTSRQTAGPKVVSEKPSAPVNPKRSHRKQASRPDGESLAKKQKVQDPKAAGDQKVPNKKGGNHRA